LDARASAYLHAVLNRDRASAQEVVLKMIEGGSSLVDVYRVLGSSQVEVGLLWEKGTITVSDEHFSTETTLGCISMAADRLRKFRRELMGFAFLSPAEGEFHEVGLRMLSELLRSEGWETELHVSGPLSSALKELAARRRVDLFCFSATMSSNVHSVVEAAQAIRREQAFESAKILVGGPAFEDEKARRTLGGPAGTPLVDCLASSLPEALEFGRSVGAQIRRA
jgi:methanogenic corrinoid protein MtbC1